MTMPLWPAEAGVPFSVYARESVPAVFRLSLLIWLMPVASDVSERVTVMLLSPAFRNVRNWLSDKPSILPRRV